MRCNHGYSSHTLWRIVRVLPVDLRVGYLRFPSVLQSLYNLRSHSPRCRLSTIKYFPKFSLKMNHRLGTCNLNGCL